MMTDFAKKLKKYRLTEDEYQLAKDLLGRDLQPIEWPLFSALWSEHCSYKSSKVHLRKFSYRNASTPDMDGENAGVVELGYGEKIAFKMESHNHPSFIEPVQGAATGVGGILRDIFTMGARPIAIADYLCFGAPDANRMSELQDGVVHGISSYGNCVGVPTITGQTNFDPAYNRNILVNAMCVGYFGPDQKMALSKAKGIGNLVVYVGAKTGKDGVHGAAMASASFDDDSEALKPNIQIGDPFFEKLLIESCLEVLSKDLVVAMQDMGAAGLTSSSFEMASKGGVGLEIDLSKVPLRDPSMGPEEILLSESQERMLLICEPEKFEALRAVFLKWGLDSEKLGQVTKNRTVKLTWKNEILTDIDPDLLVEKAPKYNRPFTPWAFSNRAESLVALKNFSANRNKSSSESKTKETPSLNWIYQQYDQRVGARTAQACESSVATVQLDSSKRGLSIAVGCRPQLMKLDAYVGGLDAVYYPAFQMALQGSRALAVTDCLNFGNPQKPYIMSEFVASVEAIALAAKKLDAPVISGNVSFYNESSVEVSGKVIDQNIISTPATGLVGLRENVLDLWSNSFTEAGNSVIQVQYQWAILELEIQKYWLNDECYPDLFVQKVQSLHSDLKGDAELFKSVTAARSVSLGGVITTLEKMQTDQIGWRKLPNLPTDISEVHNVLYSFLLCTNREKEMISYLQNFFSNLPGAKTFLKIDCVATTHLLKKD